MFEKIVSSELDSGVFTIRAFHVFTRAIQIVRKLIPLAWKSLRLGVSGPAKGPPRRIERKTFHFLSQALE